MMYHTAHQLASVIGSKGIISGRSGERVRDQVVSSSLELGVMPPNKQATRRNVASLPSEALQRAVEYVDHGSIVEEGPKL